VNYPQQTTDASGFFTASLSGLPGGTYNWRVKGPNTTPDTNTTPGFLANTGSVVLSDAAGLSAIFVEMGLMRSGDANNDNTVSVADFNILRNTFGKIASDPGFDPRADFNRNQVVDISDFNLLRINFGSSGAPPIGPASRSQM
jgi:hypothetical protein